MQHFHINTFCLALLDKVRKTGMKCEETKNFLEGHLPAEFSSKALPHTYLEVLSNIEDLH